MQNIQPFAHNRLLSFFCASVREIRMLPKENVNLNVVTSDGLPIQRERCWDISTKQSFISLLAKKYPMPPIWALLSDEQVWQIIDGANRLTTIYEFQNNQFSVPFDFGNGLNECYFKDMPLSAKKNFKGSTLPFMWANVGQVGDDPLLIDLAMLELYDLLNIEPVPQDKTHLKGVRNRAAEIRQKIFI